MREKISPDEAAPGESVDSKVEGESDVWTDFPSQPYGTGLIFPISSSVVASRHPVCVAPSSSNSEKSAPVVGRPYRSIHPREALIRPDAFPQGLKPG